MSPSGRGVVAVIVILWTCPFVWVGPALAQANKQGDLAIVVHPSTPVNELTFTELRQVFLGERQYWTPAMSVVLLMRAPVAVEREAVLKVIYEMTEAQFKQYWIATACKKRRPRNDEIQTRSKCQQPLYFLNKISV